MASKTTFILLLLCIISGHAQVGNLDASFSGDGKLLTPIGSGHDWAYGVTVQGNNRIVAVGVSRQTGDDDFAIVRYLEDGTLDNSFSGDGIFTIDFDGGDDEARDVEILPNGNILVGGTASMGADLDFAFALLDTDGKLVSSFDGDGLMTYDFANTDDALSRITVYKNRIYAVGSSIKNDLEQYAIAAFQLNGAPDNAFSQDGMLVFDVDAGQDVATAIAVQPDDKILVAGYTGVGFEKEFCVVRFKADGSLDNSFSSDGIVIPDVGTIDDRAYGIALQADQKIVVGGSSYGTTGYDFALIRLLQDGTLDLDFGEDGYAIETIGPFFDDARDMILQPDDKILITGYAAQAASDADFGLARFTADGMLDNTFSQDGKVITIIGGGESEDEAHAIALQPDGKIVIVGEAQNNSNNLDFAVARYLSGLTTSVDEGLLEMQGLTLFPNPTTSSINASFSLNADQVLVFSIQDISGLTISRVKDSTLLTAGNHTLSFELPSSLMPGTYLWCVTNAEGRIGYYQFLVQ